MKTKILEPNQAAIKTAAKMLRNGKLVAFPTETVYGLGACVFNESAIKKIFEVKGRPQDNPIIVHIAKKEDIFRVASSVPSDFELLASHFFPGPLTLVVPRKESVPNIVSAGLPTVAVRMPNHPVALALIEAAGEPLVAPSANPSGKVSPTTARHVFDDLDGKIPLVLDGGPSRVGIESTVLDLTSKIPTILRPGNVTKEAIEKVLNKSIDTTIDTSGKVKSPGVKYRHYAPEATVHIFENKEDVLRFVQKMDPSKTYLLSNEDLGLPNAFTRHPLTQQTLFASLREGDTLKRTDIVMYLDPKTKLDAGLVDRISKAAGKKIP